MTPAEFFERDQVALEYAGPDRVVAAQEVAEELALTADASFRVNTGFPSIDRICNGVEAGELIVVSGPTSGGKTTFLMSITQNMAKEEVKSAWFTLEVTPRQFITKISNQGMLPIFYLPRRGFEDVPKEFVTAFEREHGRTFQMFDWIEFKIIEASIKFDTKVIFIDHVHQLFSLAKIGQSRNMSAEVGDLVAKIKNLAVQHNLIIFLIAHNRDDAENKNKDPYMESVRDSGLIIRYADTVIGIWRVANMDDNITSSRISAINEDDNKSKIRVWKNRREGTRGAFYAYHHNHYLTEDAFHGY